MTPDPPDSTHTIKRWRQLSPRALREELDHYLHTRIPGARLTRQPLPQAPSISLYLINADYPRNGLNPDQARALMDDPPYWGFCWGSGQALARWLLDNPGSVRGKTLVDLGCGSGVAGIAAKMAGAARVILCDRDSRALTAADLNADLNGVAVEFSNSLETLLDAPLIPGAKDATIVTVADVFYDRENLPLLPVLTRHFGTVLVADSRLRGRPLDGMEIFARPESHTVPDLDESAEFNRISLYRSRCRYGIRPPADFGHSVNQSDDQEIIC